MGVALPAGGVARHRAVAGVIAVVAACLTLSCSGPGGAAGPTADVATIVLEGRPEEIGRAHGRRLGPQIRLLEEQYVGALLGDAAGRARALAAAAGFRDRLRPHHRAELDAVAEAVGIDRERMLLANCFLDLLPSVGCSTVALPAAAAPDGVARLGRNLDFPSRGVADGHSQVLVVRPEGRHAFAAVTWPGLVGVLSGMNEHGLTLANMEVAREPRPADAMPYALLYRTVLEECRTVAEAIALVEREGRQTANNLMLMDAAGDRALLEITPERVVVRRAAADAPLAATNHHRAAGEDPPRCDRYACLVSEAERDWGRLDRDALHRTLALVSQGDLTLQSMIFEPRERVVHLAVGRDAARRRLRPIDLTEQFRR